MINEFHLTIPLPRDESFELLKKSGSEVTTWKMDKADSDQGLILWKQGFLSLLGTATIVAQLERKSQRQTLAIIKIHKPLQVIDPFKISDRIYNKLEKTVQRNLPDFTAEGQ